MSNQVRSTNRMMICRVTRPPNYRVDCSVWGVYNVGSSIYGSIFSPFYIVDDDVDMCMMGPNLWHEGCNDGP